MTQQLKTCTKLKESSSKRRLTLNRRLKHNGHKDDAKHRTGSQDI